jgi:hypothetical protein
MNREDIIRMAQEAGEAEGMAEFVFHPVIERFADLVASAERSACAKLCDDLDDDVVDGLAGWQYGEAIRARGQA